ncbi:transglycosylase family protein [Tomitella gaofuii]|uniref:transglycosylase family protein n=1 Tax=Tomitella gaofuii TaxID=2760083 RepID=UPI0039A54551
MAAPARNRTLGATIATSAALGIALTLGAGTAVAYDWTGVAQCESGGNWHIDTGNGYYGGLQFSMPTWQAYGGVGNPAHATRAEQVRVAERVLAGQGIGAWPTCGTHLRPGISPALATEGLLPPGSLDLLPGSVALPPGSMALPPGSMDPGSFDPLGSAAAMIPPGSIALPFP